MQSNGAGHNGSSIVKRAEERIVDPPPDRVRELAEACVRFVERATGVKLDYEPETLPVLDHWIAGARAEASEPSRGGEPLQTRPETMVLVAHAAGAYFGEVVRRRHASWWRTDGDDPSGFRIELEAVYLSFNPVQLIADAITRDGDAETLERFEIDDADREAIAARLAELPPVSEDEFFAASTRLEVIDIVVDAIRTRKLADEDGDAALGPDDYSSD